MCFHKRLVYSMCKHTTWCQRVRQCKSPENWPFNTPFVCTTYISHPIHTLRLDRACHLCNADVELLESALRDAEERSSMLLLAEELLSVSRKNEIIMQRVEKADEQQAEDDIEVMMNDFPKQEMGYEGVPCDTSESKQDEVGKSELGLRDLKQNDKVNRLQTYGKEPVDHIALIENEDGDTLVAMVEGSTSTDEAILQRIRNDKGKQAVHQNDMEDMELQEQIREAYTILTEDDEEASPQSSLEMITQKPVLEVGNLSSANHERASVRRDLEEKGIQRRPGVGSTTSKMNDGRVSPNQTSFNKVKFDERAADSVKTMENIAQPSTPVNKERRERNCNYHDGDGSSTESETEADWKDLLASDYFDDSKQSPHTPSTTWSHRMRATMELATGQSHRSEGISSDIFNSEEGDNSGGDRSIFLFPRSPPPTMPLPNPPR